MKGVKNVKKVRGVASVVVCVLAASSGVPAQTRQWNGTIVLTRNASATYKESTAAATDTMNDVLTETITVTIRNGKAEATIDYLLKQHVDGIRNDEIANRTVTIDRTTQGKATTQQASFHVETYNDGTYSLTFTTGGIAGQLNSSETVATRCNVPPPGCESRTETTTQSDKVTNLSGGSADVSGKIAGKPNALAGSESQPFQFGGITHQLTIRWNLSR